MGRKRDEDKTPHLFIRRENIEGNICWVLCWTAVRTQLMTLTKSVWSMCGSLVGGVGPKMKSCYLLRVKQRLAFCCPLLPNKLFSVFCDIVFLPGVFSFQTYRRFLWFVPIWVRGWVRNPSLTVPKLYELTRFKAAWSLFPPANRCFLLHIYGAATQQGISKSPPNFNG